VLLPHCPSFWSAGNNWFAQLTAQGLVPLLLPLLPPLLLPPPPSPPPLPPDEEPVDPEEEPDPPPDDELEEPDDEDEEVDEEVDPPELPAPFPGAGGLKLTHPPAEPEPYWVSVSPPHAATTAAPPRTTSPTSR